MVKYKIAVEQIYLPSFKRLIKKYILSPYDSADKKFDSNLEHNFAVKFNFKKNEERFLIKEFPFIGNRYIQPLIYYTPDFVGYQVSLSGFIRPSLLFLEVKGYHPNMAAYYLKRKILLEYITNEPQEIIFIECRYIKSHWVFTKYALIKSED